MRGRDELYRIYVGIRKRILKWGKQMMMLTQENGGINWQITTNADTPHGGKGTEGDVIW